MVFIKEIEKRSVLMRNCFLIFIVAIFACVAHSQERKPNSVSISLNLHKAKASQEVFSHRFSYGIIPLGASTWSQFFYKQFLNPPQQFEKESSEKSEAFFNLDEQQDFWYYNAE